MKKLNRLLIMATLAVLLLPAAVVGPLAEACCGVKPISLAVTDAPDPTCLEDQAQVTISGTYTVVPEWTPWDAYNTGVDVRIWDPGGNQVVNEGITLAIQETAAPKDFPFSYPYLPGMVGTYTYEVVAWSVTSYGRMEISAVGQTFTVEVCNEPPVANADGPYTVDEGGTVALNGTASYDPDFDILTYAWDLDNDGAFETSGAEPSYAGVDGPFLQDVTLIVCDPSGACDTDATTVTVLNVSPTANAGSDQTVYRNDTVNLAGTWIDPATSYDDPYAWTWDLNGDGGADDGGNALYGDTIARTTVFALEGFYTLTFDVTDNDNGNGNATVTIEVLNRPPDCSQAAPSLGTVWPPNNQFVPITVLGVTDPEGDTVTIQITAIRQDEPVDSYGDGKFVPDGQGVGAATAEVRAERSGTKKVPGDGRFYHISFQATDGHGGLCEGLILVSVPHDQNKVPVDGGALYDSTQVAP